ncbi:MAG: TetR/AcrR family transcriptional regulator [Smithellaceae bacterium]|jgi:AcrR family transcriptional regulator
MERSERKEREFNVRRAEILEQAERIFATKGFYNVTMAEIAGASGFSIGSLYQFFEGKEHLYRMMLCEKLDLMYAEIRKEVNAAKDITDKITTLIDAHFRFVEKNTDFFRVFFCGENDALSEMMTSLRRKLIDDYLQHITFIENLMKSGIKRGFLRPLVPRELAGLLFGLIRSTAIDWMLLPKEKSLNLKKDLIMEIFLQGVKKHDK